jgi:hypothetical protein
VFFELPVARRLSSAVRALSPAQTKALIPAKRSFELAQQFLLLGSATVWRGREKLHYLNPMPIHEISERWIGKFDRQRLA